MRHNFRRLFYPVRTCILCLYNVVRTVPFLLYNSYKLYWFLLHTEISASDVGRYSEKLRTSCGCVIKTMEPKSAATIDDMRNVVSKVNSLEEEKMIAPWDEEKIPEEVVNEKPTPG